MVSKNRWIFLGMFSCITFCTNLSLARNKPIIESLRRQGNEVRIKINRGFKNRYLRQDFFVEYDRDISLEKMPYEIITMPFLCNVITLIWISGKNYSIKSMDEDLYHSFKKLKEIFRLSYPNTSWDGELIPKRLVKFSKRFPVNKKAPIRRALLFSGGLDSTSSLFSHNDEKLLLITAWGQFDSPLKEEDAWMLRKARVKEVAAQYGHANTFLKSNYAEFFNWPVLNSLSPEIESWRVAAVDGIGWSGLVAPIFFAKGCSELYIASSNSWYFPYIDCINPFVDTTMRFANYRLIHDQFDITRMDKALFIAQKCKEKGWPKPYVKVCQRTKLYEDNNCCACKKCLLTILSFCVAGEDHKDYGFNVPLKKAVHKTLEMLHRKPNEYEVLWNFIDIQSAFIERQERYSHYTLSILKPFLKADLTKMKISDKMFTLGSKVDWAKFTELVPSVKIPSNLLESKWAVERKASTVLRSSSV